MNIIPIVTAYVVGSIPVGWLLARAAGISDITRYGSGNVGATNVARVLGLRYFFLVFFLDSAKAFYYLTWLRAYAVDMSLLMMCAVTLLVGNGISFMLQGKGGKGIATAFGILLALNGWILYGAFCVWLLVIGWTKNMGISNVAALMTLPVLACIHSCEPDVVLFMLFICCWGIWKHVANIRKFFCIDQISA